MWFQTAVIAILVTFLATNKRYRWIYIIFKTLPRDIRGLGCLIKLYKFVQNCTKENTTLLKKFQEVLEKNPHKIAFCVEEETWTFTDVDRFSNKIARYFLQNGYKKGDKVALFLENCVEYPCIWLGLLKIGVNTALINTNLVKDSLLHSITTTNCKSVIFGTNLEEQINNVPDLNEKPRYQLHEKGVHKATLKGCINLRKELKTVSDEAITEYSFESSCNDPAIYIFTSGTTGLPKAAIMTHLRCLLVPSSLKVIGIVNQDDIFYTPLPLYHTAGGLMGVGQALASGLTVCIRKKFSASQYFKDCEKYNATAAQYVGELCRYVLATPLNGPINHKVRVIVGNGLRPQIWKQFVERFKIKQVFEFYGATESVSNLVNIDSKVGAVGFIPRYFGFLYPMKLIKCDEVTGEPLRNPKGFCIECGVEEPGLLVGKIEEKNVFKYDGYTDRNSSEKKVVKNVFCIGDLYFNSGDILVHDELGYYYFKDRTGDTFRWKGENVSTSEIEAIISNILQLSDVVVYGVEIPKTEGNAGMAAIVDPDGTLNVQSLVTSFKENLPSYAVPIFLRVLDSVPLTGTFKLKKTDLRQEGYNVEKINDTIYFLDPQQKQYVVLVKNMYENILNGKIRV